MTEKIKGFERVDRNFNGFSSEKCNVTDHDLKVNCLMINFKNSL